MERVYEEVDELKAENEKLKAECKNKTEHFENLKRAQNEQLIKLREANSKLEKQSVELDEKTEEISSLRQMHDDIKRSLNEKESILKRVSAANDKLKVEWEEKYRKCEEENRRLMFALDEANEKNIAQAQNINVYRAEIEGLKGLLSASQKKCMEAEKNAKGLKELRDGYNILSRLEDENSKIKNELKWKKEQFKHLEEAHEKVKVQFKASKREWEKERSKLFDEISSLQTSLDSQTRISDDLQKRLEMCNHALSREETRRKFLEVQVSEYKARYEDVFAECQGAKSQLECLTVQRGEEIADLRHSLSTKAAYYKELEYQKGKLEQENQELLASLKELREAAIQGSGNSSSLNKLKNKLKTVEQIHRNCSANLRAKEAEWRLQLETMTQDLYNFRSELERKDATLEELKKELEYCNSLAVQVQLQYEELVVVSLVLKSAISEAQSNFMNLQSQMTHSDKEGEEKLSLLTKQLEQKNATLAKAQKDFEEEHERATALLSRIEYLDGVEDQQLQMQREIERYKRMLEESSRYQMKMKEEAQLLERDSDEKVREACNALDVANSELAEEREKVASLSRQVESFALVLEKQLLMQKELERSKEILEESSKREIDYKDQIAQLESGSNAKIRELSDALDSTNAKLAQEYAKAKSLLMKIESFDQIEEERLSALKELEKHKEMLEESSSYQNILKEKVSQLESELEKKLLEDSETLERVNSEVGDKICEVHQLEFESWVWKSIAERFKLDLEKSQELRKELEASLLAQVEVGETTKQERKELLRNLKERDGEIKNLQGQIMSLAKDMKASSAQEEAAISFESEKGRQLKIMREKEIEWLEQESLCKELEVAAFEHITAERTLENEKKSLAWLIEQKDKKIDELLQRVDSAKENFNSSLSLQLSEKQADINMAHEAWERVASAKILANLEIEEKKLVIIELEEDIHNLHTQLEMQEKSFSCFRRQASDSRAELELNWNELREQTDQMHEKLRASDALVAELRGEKCKLHDDVNRLSQEKESLMAFVQELSDRMCELSDEDTKLTGVLGSVVQSFDNIRSGEGVVNEELFDSLKENVNVVLSPHAARKHENIPEERLPFRPVN